MFQQITFIIIIIAYLHNRKLIKIFTLVHGDLFKIFDEKKNLSK